MCFVDVQLKFKLRFSQQYYSASNVKNCEGNIACFVRPTKQIIIIIIMIIIITTTIIIIIIIIILLLLLLLLLLL